MENARHDDQKAVMRRTLEKGECPFCPGAQSVELEPVLKQGENWTVRNNRWPYESTTLHLIFIAKKHAEHLSDLDSDAAFELMELFRWAEGKFNIESGAFMLRFGDPSLNGATVRHLHAHLVVADPNTEKPEYKDVKFRVGPKSAK
jgi:diadenosine tetraphosphate (Ap4A) HIT family hydrolase